MNARQRKKATTGPFSYVACFDRPLTPAMRHAFWEAARPLPWWRRAWRWLTRWLWDARNP